MDPHTSPAPADPAPAFDVRIRSNKRQEVRIGSPDSVLGAYVRSLVRSGKWAAMSGSEVKYLLVLAEAASWELYLETRRQLAWPKAKTIRQRSGLSRSPAYAALDRLRGRKLKLLKVLSPGRGRTSGCYEVLPAPEGIGEAYGQNEERLYGIELARALAHGSSTGKWTLRRAQCGHSECKESARQRFRNQALSSGGLIEGSRGCAGATTTDAQRSEDPTTADNDGQAVVWPELQRLLELLGPGGERFSAKHAHKIASTPGCTLDRINRNWEAIQVRIKRGQPIPKPLGYLRDALENGYDIDPYSESSALSWDREDRERKREQWAADGPADQALIDSLTDEQFSAAKAHALASARSDPRCGNWRTVLRSQLKDVRKWKELRALIAEAARAQRT